VVIPKIGKLFYIHLMLRAAGEARMVSIADEFGSDRAFVPRFIGIDALRVSETAGHAVKLCDAIQLEDILPFLGQIALIRISLPESAAGLTASMAHRLRAKGFRGRLEAADAISDVPTQLVTLATFDEALSQEVGAEVIDQSCGLLKVS
jgi:uncharacterized protein (DUF934 family)